MVKRDIRLGFEVGTGEPVDIPLRHMVVCGQTQEAGKTTTMEALIHRAQLPAIAFITKRGERSFEDASRLQPYFRERADWQFVESVMAAVMRERMKFERSWIIKASKKAKTLADVQRNVREELKTAGGISEGVYTTLDAYLDIVVPRIASITWAKEINLTAGVNVMDVSDRDVFPPELQGLVMRSAIEWVYQYCDGTITIIPEAWEFLPQMRGSPVKLAAVELIRKGAGLRNYVWLDSQDIGGVDKEVLRSCPVWLLGVQREANEIERTLKNIPANMKKPKPADVATLKLGEFFACYGEHVRRVYVWPKWMSEIEARNVAMGAHAPKPAPRSSSYVSIQQPAPADPNEWRAAMHGQCKLESDAPAIVKADCAAHIAKVAKEKYEEGFEKGYAAACSMLNGQLAGVIRSAAEFMDDLKDLGAQLARILEDQPPGSRAQIADAIRTADGGQLIVDRDEQDRLPPRKTKKAASRGDAGQETAALKLVGALARYRSLTWNQAAIVAGMLAGNGNFFGGRKYALEKGLAIETNGRASITPEGRALVEKGKPVPLADLVALWSARLKQPGGLMLQTLAKHPKKSMTVEQLAAATKLKPGNGHWFTGVKAIVKAGLVDKAGDGSLSLSTFLQDAAAI